MTIRTKKLINAPEDIIPEFIEGLVGAYPDLLTVEGATGRAVVARHGPRDGKVGIVIGGGSGHEPAFAGYVGRGLADAAAVGNVFASPSPEQILDAGRAADGGAGVVFLYGNYTGDVLNFETAAEMAQAEGVEVRSVLINDDVAVEDSLYTAGRRGVGGTVLVERIAGAAAERGDSLDGVTGIAQRVNDNVRSMGVALSACTVPHAGVPSFDLTEEEIEIGIGIHGEPGRHKIAMENAAGITDRLLEPILADLKATDGDRVLLFVNGMGGTPASELYIVYRRARQVLAERGISVERSLVGNYITALEMQGASISVLKLDDEMVELWDTPVWTPALRWGV